MRQRPKSGGWIWAAAIVAVVSAAAACSGEDDAGAPATAAPSTEAATSTTGAPMAEPSASDEPASSSAASTTEPLGPGTETLATVPEQGVPGIESADPFCRAWSEFAGSFQALAGASAAGAGATRLEVVASAAVSSAAQTMSDEFPVPIAFEREVFVNDVIGPFARRADRASEELRAAGLSPAEIELLGDLWLMALVDAGVDDPEIDVAVPDDLTDGVVAAVEEFSVPAIVEDPSLVTQASAPATFEFLATNCPDQGILAGNDAID